jgi:hypothetical protein
LVVTLTVKFTVVAFRDDPESTPLWDSETPRGRLPPTTVHRYGPGAPVTDSGKEKEDRVVTTGNEVVDKARTVSGATHSMRFTELVRPVIPLTTPEVDLAMICEVSEAGDAPGCWPNRTAAAPATCGAAIDVPDNEEYPPPSEVE